MQPLPEVAALLALAAIAAFVAAPLVRRRRLPAASPSRCDLQVLERRDRALAALRELEFDHRTGKIGDDDRAVLLDPLRREAAEALRAAATVGRRS